MEYFANRTAIGFQTNSLRAPWWYVLWGHGPVEVRLGRFALYFSVFRKWHFGVITYPGQHIYQLGFASFSWAWA